MSDYVLERIKKLWGVIRACARKHGLDPTLVAAIVMVESAGNPFAIRYEAHTDKYVVRPRTVRPKGCSIATERDGQKFSWGVMQVMGWTARGQGFRGWLPAMCDPEVGIEQGCIYLAGCFKRWPDFPDPIAAYNAGSPRKTSTGEYHNQHYVDEVLKSYDSVKGWAAGGELTLAHEDDRRGDDRLEACHPTDLLDKESMEKLKTCHEGLQRLFLCVAESYSIRVMDGGMTEEQYGFLVSAGLLVEGSRAQVRTPSSGVVVLPQNEEGRVVYESVDLRCLALEVLEIAEKLEIPVTWGRSLERPPYTTKWRNLAYWEIGA